ncbi:hypothetical protein H310_13061 [Aphanomyces invadans]|uniref:WW domain-containing protein n=1 Tax=Aphanomyces invadans TaxID=157072 RepID=A0A024TG87_9STRA|nr:hypothetical protein H310_13061 [Aphanomyces invadans]ETV92606.1 hypothetical protein H310_13061 [Aphanomyces invadans]|eukprot:XP_008878642.1 hypothetical protein H310_13061 [Aphanomyces invadans]
MRELQPNDILNMAQYYNVDLTTAPFLLPIMKQAVETPLPPNWVEDLSSSVHGPRYINEQTQEQQSSHPADAYFIAQVRKAREKHAETDVVDNAWMEFRRDGAKYYYNFATNKEQTDLPSCGLLCTPGASYEASKEVFTRAADIHRQPKIRSYVGQPNCLLHVVCRLDKLDILCFHSSWNETRMSVTEKRHADIYFSISTKHFQFVLGNLDTVYTISHINGRNEKPLEAWDLYVGAKITILGRSTTLTKASMLTLQWLDYQAKRLDAIKAKLTSELCKYENSHVETTRGSKAGVSLRRLKLDIEHLREKLSEYRPDVARKIVDSLYA